MSEEDKLVASEYFFIEHQPVNWEDISVQVRSDLDFVPDILTDAELYVVNVLLSSGPLSARGTWDNITYEELRYRLKDPEVDYPAYRTVKNSLEKLVENGVVCIRPSNKGNTDKLYTINPKFKKQWKARREEIKSNNVSGELSRKTLHFYRIRGDVNE
jgi:hypothetical protein